MTHKELEQHKSVRDMLYGATQILELIDDNKVDKDTVFRMFEAARDSICDLINELENCIWMKADPSTLNPCNDKELKQ